MQKMTFSMLGVLFFILPIFVLAQTSEIPAVAVPAAPASEVQGNIACFDYYKFGSVQADLQPNLSQSVPGSTLTFSGNVINENDYPLVDGKLSAKIFRRDEATFSQGNGNPVVDQFVIEENMQIGAKGSKAVSFDWKIPANARGGEYYVGYFFTTSERYNLTGLSFTDDVIGNQAQFTVTNADAPTNVEFDKNSALLNDQKVPVAAFPLRFNGNEEVNFKVKLVNPSAEVKTLPLQWNQYNWDGQRAENKKNTKTELITLQPGEAKELQYTTIATDGAVSYLTATVQDGESRSFINVRYVKDGIEETRINFPSLTSFPIKEGVEQTLFACAHSTNAPLVKGNTLVLTLKDKEGGVISQYRYEGDITGPMGGFGQKFTPSKSYDYVTLEASLFREGSEVERVEVVYDCNTIDASQCSANRTNDGFLEKGKVLTIVGIALLGIIALIIAILLRRRRRSIQW